MATGEKDIYSVYNASGQLIYYTDDLAELDAYRMAGFITESDRIEVRHKTFTY